MGGIDGKIRQANGRLKAGGIGLTIEKSGGTLVLRGTLPPKPDSSVKTPHQQRLALGIPASADGIKQAEAKARTISGLVVSGQFDWSDFVRAKRATPQTVQDWLDQLRHHFLQRGGSLETWTEDYFAVLKRLPLDAYPSPAQLDKLILTTVPNTRTRKRYCTAIAAFAAFANIDYDPFPLAGSYSVTGVSPRDLVDDAELVKWFDKICNPGWRWVYGMMATYGIRPHEAFRLNYDAILEGNRVLEVLDPTKTGQRFVWAYYPEWFDQFDLQAVILPKVCADRSNKAVGKSVSDYFRKHTDIPFTPYTLRHCWAVRTINFNLPISDAARQMGHSVTIHERVYHRWITPRHQQKLYELLLANPQRPHPPKNLD